MKNNHQFITRFVWIAIVWKLGSLFFVTGLYSQRKSRISVRFENGRRTDSISAYQEGDVLYTSLEELAFLMNVKTLYNPQNKKMVMRVGSREIKATAMNPFILVDETVYQIPLPAIDVEGQIFVPLALFLDVIGEMLPVELDFRQGDSVLWIRNYKYNITAIEIDEIDNGSLIRLITTARHSNCSGVG